MKQVNPSFFNIPLMASPSFPFLSGELVNVKKLPGQKLYLFVTNVGCMWLWATLMCLFINCFGLQHLLRKQLGNLTIQFDNNQILKSPLGIEG